MFPRIVFHRNHDDVRFYLTPNIYTIFKKNFNIYSLLRDRERQSMSRGGEERERETQNLKQAPGSELSA